MFRKIPLLALVGYGFYEAFITYTSGDSPTFGEGGTFVVVLDIIVALICLIAIFFGGSKSSVSDIADMSERKGKRNKTVRKVWTCQYKGTYHMAPDMLQVPSEYTYPAPSLLEIHDALLKMGYTESQASSIRGGTSDCDYK